MSQWTLELLEIILNFLCARARDELPRSRVNLLSTCAVMVDFPLIVDRLKQGRVMPLLKANGLRRGLNVVFILSGMDFIHTGVIYMNSRRPNVLGRVPAC